MAGAFDRKERYVEEDGTRVPSEEDIVGESFVNRLYKYLFAVLVVQSKVATSLATYFEKRVNIILEDEIACDGPRGENNFVKGIEVVLDKSQAGESCISVEED